METVLRRLSKYLTHYSQSAFDALPSDISSYLRHRKIRILPMSRFVFSSSPY